MPEAPVRTEPLAFLIPNRARHPPRSVRVAAEKRRKVEHERDYEHDWRWGQPHSSQRTRVADQIPVKMQDLLHTKDNRRDLVLKRHVFGGADHQAERSRAGVTETEK
jgi:hypothetical protein